MIHRHSGILVSRKKWNPTVCENRYGSGDNRQNESGIEKKAAWSPICADHIELDNKWWMPKTVQSRVWEG